jgi:hypothetical protein
MTLDPVWGLFADVPVPGIAVTLLTQQFCLRDRELMRHAGTDYQLAFPPMHGLAGDGVIEEAVVQTIDHDLFKMRQRFADLTGMDATRVS